MKEEHSVLFFPPLIKATCQPGPSGNMSKDLQPTVDPTKMGLGRSIAVLTSGGDAQGKQRNEALLYFDIKRFSVEGGKTIRQHLLLLMCLITESQQAVEALLSLCLVDANISSIILCSHCTAF